MVLKILLSLPRNVCPLHLPKPLGSWISAPSAMETMEFVAKVIVPPDWYVSFCGIGSTSVFGELKLVLAVWRY